MKKPIQLAASILAATTIMGTMVWSGFAIPKTSYFGNELESYDQVTPDSRLWGTQKQSRTRPQDLNPIIPNDTNVIVPNQFVRVSGNVNADLIARTIAASNRRLIQLQLQNPDVISPDSAEILVEALEDTSAEVVLFADTLNKQRNKVLARIYLREDIINVVPDGMFLHVGTTKNEVQTTRKAFEGLYKNDFAAIKFDQKGEFITTDIDVAVLVDLSDLNTDQLQFYIWNSGTKDFQAIPDVTYYIDNHGYLHFTTNIIGDIVVTDSDLIAK